MGSIMKRKGFRLMAMVLTLVMVIGLVPVSAAKKKSVTVGSTAELYAEMVKSKVGTITYRTDATEKVSFYVKKLTPSEKKTISNIKLVIDAPNATITNKLKFKSVTILACKQYTEATNGNTIAVKAADTKVIVAKGKTVKKLKVASKTADITVKDKAIVKNLIVDKKSANVTLDTGKKTDVNVTLNQKSSVTVKGNKSSDVDINVKAKGSTVTASVPVDVKTNKDMKLNLNKGSEGSKVDKISEEIKITTKNKSTKEPTVLVNGKAVATPTPTSEVTTTPTPTPSQGTAIIGYSDGGSSSGGGYSGGSSGGSSYAPATPATTPALTNTSYFEGNYGNVSYVSKEYDSKGRLVSKKILSTYAESGISKYTYDEKNNETETYPNGDVRKPIYDANGNFIGYATYFGDKLVSAYEYTYVKNGNICTDTDISKGWNGVIESVYEYEYDISGIDPQDDEDDGRLVKSNYKEPDGKVIRVTENEFDTNGRQIKSVVKDGSGKVTSITETEYAADGSVSKWIYKDGNNKVTGYSELSSSSDGKTRITVDKKASGLIIGIDEYTYNENGYKLVRKNALGTVIETQETEYFSDDAYKWDVKKRVVTDAYGKITNILEYDEKHRQIKYVSGDWADYEYTYDDAANKVTIVSNSTNKYNRYKAEYTYDSTNGTIKCVNVDGNRDTRISVYEYDNNGRLVKVSATNQDNKQADIYEYTYGSNGRLETITNKNGKGEVTSITTYKYNEYGSEIECISKNPDGSVIDSQITEYYENGQVKKKIYKSEWSNWMDEYDETGRDIGHVDYDTQGNEVESCQSTYDDFGNLINEIRKEYDGSIEDITYENGYCKEVKRTDSQGIVTITTYVYDDNHNDVLEETKDVDGNTVSTRTSTYDKNDNILTSIYKDDQDTEIEIDSYTYDQYGRQITFSVKYPKINEETNTTTKYYDTDVVSEEITERKNSSIEISTTIWTYYENRNCKSRKEINSGKTSYEVLYNEKGRILEEYYYDNQGNTTSKSIYTYYENGSKKTSLEEYPYGKTERTYNEDENILKSTEWDSEGNILQIEENVYDEKGKLLSQTMEYPGQGKTVETYNTNGDTLKQITYDEKGNETYSRICTYNDEYQLTSEIQKNQWGSREWYYESGKTSKYVEKDADGKVVKETKDYKYDSDNRPLSYVDYVYDTDGNVSSWTKSEFEFYPNGKAKRDLYTYSTGESHELIYDETNNKVIEENYKDSEENVTQKWVNTYNENGYMTKQVHTTTDFIKETEYTGTEPNKTVREIRKNVQGEIKSQREYTYNSDGYKIKEVSSDFEANVTHESEFTGTDPNYEIWYKYTSDNSYIENYYDGTEDNRITKRIEHSDDCVYVPVFYALNTEATYYSINRNDTAVTGSAITFLELELDYQDGEFESGTVYIITEDGAKTVNMTVTTDIINGYLRTSWTFEDGRVWYWLYDEDGFVYSARLDKDGNLIPDSEFGTNPNILQ